jgi:hypothetical protein
MSERKDYTYDGHVVLKVSHSTAEETVLEIPPAIEFPPMVFANTDTTPFEGIKIDWGNVPEPPRYVPRVPVAEITIASMEHMMPTNVVCTLDGIEHVLTIYMDYKNNKVHLPKDTLSELRGSDDLFREAISTFMTEQRNETMRKYEEEFPPQRAAEFPEVPQPPEEDEEY